MKNDIYFKLRGRFALFTDPITKLGGEKSTYQLPTYEALKGVAKSIYWKPTFIWHIHRVKICKPISMETKGIKPLEWGGGNSLAYYTYLRDVEYLVHAYFEWNEHRPELEKDRIDGKHYAQAVRHCERGGRQDIFLGARECQGYVEANTAQEFEQADSPYAAMDELQFGLQFHSFDYPDESGEDKLHSHFWTPNLENGVITFPRSDAFRATNAAEKQLIRRFVRPMQAKTFGLGDNLAPVTALDNELTQGEH